MALLTLREITLGEKEFRLISDLVYEHCGINLHTGKKELVRARLAKRLREGEFRTFGDYIDHVLKDRTGKEFSLLIDSVSTNMTKFFRERGHFEFLSRRFLPRLLETKRKHSKFRIRAWSAGCSSGEEPYSLAITLLEAAGRQPCWDIKLLATDVSTRMLDRARRGRYDRQRVEPIPPMLRDRYLIHKNAGGEDMYEVRELLRSVVVLRYLNLMSDWPIKGPIDFIFCCNVMIYFDKLTQERLVRRFYDLLAPGGILFTGHSESLTGVKHSFRYVQPTIYEKL